MTDHTPFDHAPDPELGAMLRDALTGPEPDAFLHRVRSAIKERDNQWDVLERWARPRLVAAAVAAGMLLWLGVRQVVQQPSDAGVMVASNRVSTILSTQSPAPDEILASLWEAR